MLTLMGLSATAYAQNTGNAKASKIYVRAGGTYAFPQAGQMTMESGQFMNGNLKGVTTMNGTASSTTYNWDLKKASLGAGVSGVVAGGYMFNKNLGIEVAASIGISPKKYEFVETDVYPSQGIQITDQMKTKVYQKGAVLVMPSVVIQSGGNKLNVYSRIGLAIPGAGKTMVEMESYGFITQASVLTSWAYEVKNRFALGLQGALGAQYSLSSKIRLYVEANGVSLSANAKTGTMTHFTQNGTNYLEDVNVSDREIRYELSGTTTSTVDNNQPSTMPSFTSTFNNIGVGAGLVFQL